MCTVAIPAGPDKDGLSRAGDSINYLLALATGALAFSVGFVKDGGIGPNLRWIILLTCVCLSLSVVGGMLAALRVPLMLSARSYDLEDRYLILPVRAQQILFLAGVVALGSGLSLLLFFPVSKAEAKQPPAPRHDRICRRFSIEKSGLVTTRRSKPHTHTFLLNQETGELWEMQCSGSSDVQFRRVSVEGLVPNGHPGNPSSIRPQLRR